jgi:hypothetical protein
MTDGQDVGQRHRVLLIGAGRRIQNNFLPALRCMSDQFEVAGIHARTAATLVPVAERWGVPAVLSLDRVDFDGVDAVAVSVPTQQNPVVLNALAARAPKLTLLIDTPVAWSRPELRAVVPAMARFARVVVTEDYMNFPHFDLIRRTVNDGLVGKPTAITLYNSGFLYHGLALIRSLGGFQRAVRTWRQAAGSLGTNVTYGFANGFRGMLVGPYRRHVVGLTLEGTTGVITEFPTDKLLGTANGRTVYQLKQLRAGDTLTGYEIEGAGAAYRMDLPQLAAMRGLAFPDQSDINMLRGCGLMSVFQSLRDPANINRGYGAENALYDSFVSRLAEKWSIPFDPFRLVGRDMLTPFRMAAQLGF